MQAIEEADSARVLAAAIPVGSATGARWADDVSAGAAPNAEAEAQAQNCGGVEEDLGVILEEVDVIRRCFLLAQQSVCLVQWA